MVKKILIVDDHSGFRKILKKFLEKQNLGLVMVEADSERSAVKKCLKEQPDIVLLELELPQMNGIKTAKLIKGVSPRSKIIIVTMFDSAQFRKDFFAEYVDHFIGKNEFEGRLIKVLRKCLKPGRKEG